jgi:hypothetical protein
MVGAQHILHVCRVRVKYPDIATIIKVHRFKWLVCTVRVDGTRTVRKLFEGTP